MLDALYWLPYVPKSFKIESEAYSLPKKPKYVPSAAYTYEPFTSLQVSANALPEEKVRNKKAIPCNCRFVYILVLSTVFLEFPPVAANRSASTTLKTTIYISRLNFGTSIIL